MYSLRVSILTRPEGRVQRCGSCRYPRDSEFQSSPVPKDGCNDAILFLPLPDVVFQSSPVPKDGCNRIVRARCRRVNLFQSSPVPKDGCNRITDSLNTSGSTVSILTRPEGRVQHDAAQRMFLREVRFQSSPVPEDGCNCRSINRSRMIVFQSSPVPEDGCNWAFWARKLNEFVVSILTRPGGRVQLFA